MIAIQNAGIAILPRQASPQLRPHLLISNSLVNVVILSSAVSGATSDV